MKSNQSGFRSMMASNFQLLHTGKQNWREVYVGGRDPVLGWSSSSFPLYIYDYIQPPQQHLNKSDSQSSSAEVQESGMWPPSCPCPQAGQAAAGGPRWWAPLDVAVQQPST